MSTQIEVDEVEDPFDGHRDEDVLGSRILVDSQYGQQVRWRPGERLQHLFEERCDRMRENGRGDHLAVDADGLTLTYDELDAWANRVARHLLGSGARAGDRIALLFDSAAYSYVGMLAVLKINAAYVPLDAAFPADRLAYIAQDADVRVVLSLSHLRTRLDDVEATVVCLDAQEEMIAAQDSSRLRPAETGDAVDQLCYIIYTSGSTGRPKGVAIEHPSICNFVRVAVEVYGIESRDRVYQGMTIAFDFAVEEIWVPLVAGATLVPKQGGSSLLGSDLHDFLRLREVTALCCVPTLLATLDDDLPGLRFLLVSGEACPQDLVTRWHRPDRRFLNVYGPTEATVTATWTVVHPDRPVTIGVPLPTYSVVILRPDGDEALPTGEVGEIGIAGVGLARGYVNRDDLTARAFIEDRVGIEGNPSRRIYRTGDLGRVNEDGEIEYRGRIDTQVKVRGYRIELTEIESVLLQAPGIAQAVVDTYEPEPGMVELVAYYTLRSDVAGADPDHLYEHLRASLPGYMVPGYLEELAVIPMLPSDKADRKALPKPTNRRSAGGNGAHVAPAGRTEELLAQALADVLRLDRVSTEDHFFDDLGANSLLMATFCGRVRQRADLPSVAMRDVYLQPTIKKLAAVLDRQAPQAESSTPVPPRPVRQTRTSQYALCGALQLLLFLGYTYMTAVILVEGFEWISASAGWVGAYLRSVIFSAATFLILSATPIAAKWLLVGRWRPCEIPVWSLAYVRFWAVKVLIRSNPLVLFVGSPLYVLYLKALGAKIGPGVAILSPIVPVCTDLLTIGGGTVIRKDASFTCYRAHAGAIQTGAVTLGSDVLVGEATVLDIGTSMGDGAQLGHSSSLHAGQAVPDGESWHGSPAQPTDVDYRAVEPAACGNLRRVSYSILQLVNRLVLFGPLAFAAVFTALPEYLDTGHLTHSSWVFYLDVLAISFVLFFGGVLVSLAIVTTVPRLLDRALTPDRVYPLYGFRFAVQRTISRMTNLRFFMELTGDSSLIVHYLRVLGYDMGRVQQTGSNFGVALKHETPYLSSIGTGTMVSDGLSIINADFSSSSFRVSEVRIGSRSFFGNNIAYPTGSRAGDNCLFATKVMVPVDGEVREGVGLLGSPCFEIPRSVQRDSAFDALSTGDELRRRLRGKNKHNAATIVMFLISRWIYLFVALLLGSVAAAFHGLIGAIAVAGTLVALTVFTVAYFVLIERASLGFRALSPMFCSIYQPSFWRHERFWKLSATAYLEVFNGTPFKNVIWRLLGVRVGRRVFDDGCAIPEKTLVSIGDDCTLNALSTIQCHSMEDGAFKVDGITIGAGSTLGVNAFVHYGTTIGDGAALAPDSFLMKGEEVPPGAFFGGNPARPLPSSPAAVTENGGGHVVTLQAARSLLGTLRSASPETSPALPGVRLSLFRLDDCRRLEPELTSLLTEDERQTSSRLASDQRRLAFIASRALVRALLSVEWRQDVTPQRWRLGRTHLGKLTVSGPEGTGIDVSISRPDGVLAVAVSDEYDVGVDVEPSGRSKLAPGLSSVLSPVERTRLEALPVEDRASHFLRMWTLKEAYAKCTGAGAALEFADVSTFLDPPGVTLVGAPDAPRPSFRFHQEERRVGSERLWVALAVAPRLPAERGAPVVQAT